MLVIQALLLNLKAQNLVYNGYFETYSVCPTARSQQNLIQLDYAAGWQAAALSPDYYNACASISSGVNVPYSQYGYQQDCCGGQGYAGIFLLATNTTNNDDREYIYTKLIDTLKAGHKYLASMYVNKPNGWNYAVATIGMLFTDTAVVLPWPQGFISANPQVKNNVLLADTVNWILIQDTVTAIGNEAYLTIGNFNTTATCDSANVGGNGAYYGYAYYYVDGVNVTEIQAAGIKQVVGSNVQVTVYPNPASNLVQVTNAGNSGQISLYDVLGNEVPTPNPFQRKGNSATIDVSSLPNGVYFLNVKTAEDVLSKKVVVQH